jgi:predicted dehydrogenase
VSNYVQVPGVDLVGLCDVDGKRAQALADEFNVPKVFTDYKDLLKEDLDAVSVCTPNVFHAPVALAAFKRGLHVLCEKPMATTAADAQAMARAARKAKRVLMVAHQSRFRNESQTLKKFIDRGRLGDIFYARAGYVRRRGIPGAGSWFTTKAMAGGGALIDIGVHALDLVLYFMGFPKPVTVLGMTQQSITDVRKALGGWGTPNLKGVIDVEDFAAGLVRFDTGATLLLEASWHANVVESRMVFDLIGTKGGAKLNPLVIATEDRGVVVDVAPQVPKDRESAYLREVRHFIDCIRKGREPLITGEQGVVVTTILESVYRSAASGQAVSLR